MGTKGLVGIRKGKDGTEGISWEIGKHNFEWNEMVIISKCSIRRVKLTERDSIMWNFKSWSALCSSWNGK